MTRLTSGVGPRFAGGNTCCSPVCWTMNSWPGTHLRFGQYLAERGAHALTRIEAMTAGPYPKIELGEPVQALGPAGSVLFAHYRLDHNTGDYDGAPDEERRETIYYRLHATGHRDRWCQVVTGPLVELRIPGHVGRSA